MIHVSIKPDVLFEILGFPITNTLITTWLTIAFLSLIAYLISRNIKEIPGRAQNLAEVVIDGLLGFLTMIAGNRETAVRHFPAIATVFFLVLFSNWMGILPGVGTIGFWQEAHHEEEAHEETHVEGEHSEGEAHIEDSAEDPLITEEDYEEFAEVGAGVVNHGEEEHAEEEESKMLIPLFRSANSDLNITLSLALLVVTLAHVLGISALGFKSHAGKFFTFSSPINFFVGILEFIGEFSRIVSFSFRLFGNIFAGEVLLVIISFLVPYVVPIPFLGLELFVGVVQAAIFAVLGMIFFVSAEASHHPEEGAH